MQDLPDLRVAPIEEIRPHEDFDPFRVDRLRDRIDSDGIQINPMVCTTAPDGTYVLLDGATRREAFNRLGAPHAVIQIVDPTSVTLETWHHVLQNGKADTLMEALEASESFQLVADSGTPRINVGGDAWKTARAVSVSTNACLNALVDCYHGQMTVTRVTDPREKSVQSTHHDWTAIVEFPALTIDDVMTAATEADYVPAGITRFVVPARALRLNIPLDFLMDTADTAAKQEHLDAILTKRAREGRIRRYDEPVIILDD
jgi:L-serine kinase (ATP) / ParB family transcriptional regulator, heme-responsive regulator